MKIFFLVTTFILLFSTVKLEAAGRPALGLIKNVVSLLPAQYRQEVLSSLKKAGTNGPELIRALTAVDPDQREGMAFLIANMPDVDLTSLSADFLLENLRLAYKAVRQAPWGRSIPKDIFLNEILPYASLNERRDRWRRDFYGRFIKVAQGSKSIDQAVLALNQYVFKTLHVGYDGVKRPKPDQSPYESIAAHYASCTGLSIMLTDALRSVGIPARIAAIAMWPDNSGNHTWVEIWDGKWHYTGAAEPRPLDQAWFTDKAEHTDAQHPIFASSFKKTGLSFPLRWAPDVAYVSAVDVTKHYTRL